jgi:acetylornithine/succinyldiaminopimelate/putrescine aminotransferase
VRFSSAGAGAATFAELLVPAVHEATLNGRPVAVADGRIALTGLAEENVLTVVADRAYSRTGAGLHRDDPHPAARRILAEQADQLARARVAGAAAGA